MAAIVDLDISSITDRAADALSSAICAIGVFDGVHLGHRYLIEKTIQEAHSSGSQATIITFDKDPDELFCGRCTKKLMSNSARIEALSHFDADAVAVLKFDEDLASMIPVDFLDAVFAGGAPKAIYVGEDFGFGKGAQGSLLDIEEWAHARGFSDFESCAVSLKTSGGEPITSTRIRSFLASAKLEEALGLLGHPYRISGPIAHGRGQGTGFGVSTADLRVLDELMAIADGVYAAYANLGDDPKRYMAAVSIGIPPTFEETAKANVEAHLLDFEGDIYGEELTLDMRHYLRPMRKFESIDELMDAIRSDIDDTRALLS